MMKFWISASVTGVIAFTLSCADKTPDRNYIPIIKDRLYLVQEAFRSRNTAALDSLVADNLKDDTASFKNMVRLIYGSDGSFTFQRFGDCEIAYVDNAARADCFSVDATGRQGRPLTVTFERNGKSWLLKRIQENKQDSASVGSSPSTK